jgi:hypothetical protein
VAVKIQINFISAKAFFWLCTLYAFYVPLYTFNVKNVFFIKLIYYINPIILERSFAMKKTIGKLAVLSLCSAFLLTSVPTHGFAASSLSQVAVNDQQDNAFVKKVDPFVKLDANTMRFFLTSDAKKHLSSNEYSQAVAAINQTNALIKKNKSNLIANGKKVSINQKMVANSIDTNAYWDYELFWWGHRFYLSHELCQDIRAEAMGIGGAGTITAGILVGLGVPGWVASIIVGSGVLSLYVVTKIDKGNGVYIDTFHVGVPGVPNVYSA